MYVFILFHFAMVARIAKYLEYVRILNSLQSMILQVYDTLAKEKKGGGGL
jgi:hypothetical protein